MHAQPGTVGYNPPKPITLEVTFRFPERVLVAVGDRFDELASALAADVVTLLDDEFRAIYVEDVVPEIGARVV